MDGTSSRREGLKNINKFTLAPKIQNTSKFPEHGRALSQCLDERKNTKLDIEI